MRRLTLLLVLVAAAGSFLAFRPIMTTNATAVEGVSALVSRALAERLIAPLAARWRYSLLNFPSTALAFLAMLP